MSGMTPLELASAHSQAVLSAKIFEILRASVEIMDEVDVLILNDCVRSALDSLPFTPNF
jgi:hypothetical protein